MYEDDCGQVYDVGSVNLSDEMMDQQNAQTSEKQNEMGLLDEQDYGQEEKIVEEQNSKSIVKQYLYNYDSVFENVQFQQSKENKNKDRYNLGKYRKIVCNSQDYKKTIIKELTQNQHNYIDIIRKCMLDYQLPSQQNIQQQNNELRIIVEQSQKLPVSFQNYNFDEDEDISSTIVYYNPDKLFFTIGKEATAGNVECQYCPSRFHKLVINEVQLKSEVLQFIHILVDYSQLQIKGNIQRNLLKLQQLFRKNNKSAISFESIRKICAKQLDKKKKLRIQDVTQHSQQILLKISSNENKYQEGSEIKQFDLFLIGSIALMEIKNIYLSFKLFLDKQNDKKNMQEEDFINYVHRILSNLSVKVKFISSYPNIDELLQQICSKTLDLNALKYKLQQTPLLYQQLEEIQNHSTLLVQIKKDSYPIQFFALLGHKDTSNLFLFGRGDLNTIRFEGNQVSRCHGEIRYLGNNQWRIVDGGRSQAQEQWTCSTMGTWKLLKQKTFYHIDNLQLLRYGNQLIRFDLQTNYEQENTTEQEFQYQLDDIK